MISALLTKKTFCSDTMDEAELMKVLRQLSVLKELEKDYGHKTLNNVSQSLEERVKYHNDTINKRRYDRQ